MHKAAGLFAGILTVVLIIALDKAVGASTKLVTLAGITPK